MKRLLSGVLFLTMITSGLSPVPTLAEEDLEQEEVIELEIEEEEVESSEELETVEGIEEEEDEDPSLEPEESTGPFTYDIQDWIRGVEEDTTFTTIQFGFAEEGLVTYTPEQEEYFLEGFNADQIFVTFDLHWTIPEEVELQEEDELTYQLPSNIEWDKDFIVVHPIGELPTLTDGRVWMDEEDVLHIQNFDQASHLELSGIISALELEEPEEIVEEVETQEEDIEEEEVVEKETVSNFILNSFTFNGIGSITLQRSKEHVLVMRRMMLGAPIRPLAAGLDSVDVSDYLVGRQDSPGLYTYVRFGTQTFVLPRNHTELAESIDKLDENPRQVEVNLVWNMNAKSPELSDANKDTRFQYTLPDGIKWDWSSFPPEERIIRDTKNPTRVVGHFEVEGNTVIAYYTDAFLNQARSTSSGTFTTFVNISGSVTEADWDDTGDQPYHFEGVGEFQPLVGEATTRIKVSKSLRTNDGNITDLIYLGNGKYRLQYQTAVSATYRTEDPNVDPKLTNVKVTDTMPDALLSVNGSTAGWKLYDKEDHDISSRLGSSCAVSGNKQFTCTISEVWHDETVYLRYYLELDLNGALPSTDDTALSDMVRRFENDVDVEAPNPADSTPLKDSSFAIDTFTASNPKKNGERKMPPDNPKEDMDQVDWTIIYNEGKFAKDSGTWGGINIGGTYVRDTMGEEQDLVDESSFKIYTSADGGTTWDEWTVSGNRAFGMTASRGGQSFNITWEDSNDDGILNQFDFQLPDPFYDVMKIEYTTKSTNPYTLVKLSNTASIASDPDQEEDVKSGDGDADGVGPGTVPKVEKEGDELGPDGNFEWTSDLTVHEGYSRNVRYYDAMENDLELLDSQYPIEVYRVTKVDGEEVLTPLEEGTDWILYKNPNPTDHIKNKVNDDDEPNNPWLKADLDDPEYSYSWYIEFTGDPANNNILPADGYEYENGDKKDSGDFAVYRIKYITNAPKPLYDEATGQHKTRKFYNEGQIRTKSDDLTDDKDRYNSSDAELEKKYIEKTSNDSQYENVTGDTVDTTHGYIGWYVRVYPLEARNYVEIRDDFSYSTDQTSMTLVDGSVHVYVSDNKNLPSASDEISPSFYTISNSSTSGFTVRINRPQQAGITKSSFIYVFYQTRVNPRINNTSITYTNTATLNRDGDKEYPPAKATRTRNDVVVAKNSSRNGQIVTYTLEINKQELKIDPAKGVLTIEDTRGESIEYVEGSMQFFDGNTGEELSGEPYQVVSTGHVLEIKIPDEKYVKITYQAWVTKKDGDLTGDDAKNTVVIRGATGFSAENHLKGRVQRARAGAHIDDDHPWIKIMKYDKANPAKVLEGAEFTFTGHTVDLATGELAVAAGEQYTLGTDENGEILFTYDDEAGIITYKDLVYKVEETTPPAGYQKDPTIFYVLFTDNATQYDGLTFTLDGEEIEVIIEDVQFLYRIDVPNSKTPPPSTTTPPKHNVPNTSDDTHLGGWLLLFFLALLGVNSSYYFLRRREVK